MTVNMTEFFSFLGFPARVAGRALLITRYLSNGGATVRSKKDYGVMRFGKNVRFRPWVMIDVKELEEIEDMINRGTDAQLEAWRVNQLSVCGMIAIIGALVASAGLTALQLPSLEGTHYVARGTFIMSIILSTLSVFFSGLQQSSFGGASDAKSLRIWLSSGVRVNPSTMDRELESSIVAHMILQAPFEIVVMSITLFVVGLGVYLGSAWKENLQMDIGAEGNRAVLIAFIIPTVFVLMMYGHMMGLKDREVESATKADVQPTRIKFAESSTEDVEVAAQPKGVVVNHSRILENTNSNLTELAQALQEAADARRASARADEEVAKMYERLLQKT